MKLWKTHKAVCGKASSSDSIPKDTKSLRKAMKKTNKSLRACYNCMKTERDVKLSSCSGCDSAAYCSRECQKAHWPKHKERCKYNSMVRQLMDCTMTPSQKNIQNLFEQWRSKPVVFVGTLHAKCQQIMDIQECPPTKIMRATLEFDFNLKTFVHAEEPKVIPLSQCPQQWQDALKCTLSKGKEVKNVDSAFTQYALVTCKELGPQYQRLVDLHFEENSVNQSMEELVEAGNICKGIPLKSDLFDGWEDIRKRNLKKQFDHLKTSTVYTGFLHNTMQLFNNKARLSVCVIVIYVKMGKELGKISDFVKYRKMPKSEIKTLIGNSIVKIPPHVQQPPAMMMVIFMNIDTDTIFEYDNSTRKLNAPGDRSEETYKRNADYCFKQLQDSVKQIPSELVEKVSL